MDGEIENEGVAVRNDGIEILGSRQLAAERIPAPADAPDHLVVGIRSHKLFDQVEGFFFTLGIEKCSSGPRFQTAGSDD